MTYALARSMQMDLEAFARACGLHPDLVSRFVDLGLVDAREDARGQLWFDATQLPVVARICRLRAGFALNYASVGLVLELLDRIARLEAAVRTRQRTTQRTTGG